MLLYTEYGRITVALEVVGEGMAAGSFGGWDLGGFFNACGFVVGVDSGEGC